MKPILVYRPVLQVALEAFIDEKERANSDIKWSTDFTRRLKAFATPGKLLRGSLVCYSYSIFSGNRPTKEVVKAAIALELAHCGLLINDDVMDQDDTRRGQPAMHRQYELLAEKENLLDIRHFGNSMAICGGNMAIFFALELLAQAGPDASTVAALNTLFGQELATVCAGQMEDLYLEAAKHSPTKSDIYAVMRAKTAAYSVALPLEMGAILASQPVSTRNTLHELGVAAGTIFQIRDDELGALGDSAKLGKPVGSDIKEGKKTLLYYYLFKLCASSEKTKLNSIFGNPKAATKDIRYVQTQIERYKIPDLLNKEIMPLQKNATRHIQHLKVSNKYKDELKALVEFCATRQN